MFLLIFIGILCLMLAFAHEITKPLKAYLKKPSNEEEEVLSNIAALRTKLARISMRDDYITYVKTERKIVGLEQQLSQIRLQKSGQDLIIKYGIGYGAQALIFLILLIVASLYRYVPVIIFDKKFNFAPFNSFIGYPTGIENAISVPFWIFVSSFTFNSVASFVNSS